jgi:hypothetical protein
MKQYICKDAYISRHFRSLSEHPGITGKKTARSACREAVELIYLFTRAARCSLEIFADEPREPATEPGE